MRTMSFNEWLRSKAKYFLTAVCVIIMIVWFAPLDKWFSTSRFPGGTVMGTTVSGDEVRDVARVMLSLTERSSITEAAILAQAWEVMIYCEEAKRFGVEAADADVAQFLKRRFPLSADGNSVNGPEYNRFLAQTQQSQTAFEAGLKKLITVQRLQMTVASSVTMSENQAWDWLSQKNQKVQAGYVRLRAEDLLPLVAISDTDALAFYEANKDKDARTGPNGVGYLEPMKVTFDYVLAPYDKYVAGVTVSDEEVKAYYDAHKEEFLRPKKLEPEAEETPQKPADAAPANETPKTEEPAAAPEAKDTPKAEEPAPASVQAVEPSAPPAEGQPDAVITPAEAVPPAPATPAAPAVAKPEPEYMPLEEAKAGIIETLRQQKAEQEAEKAINKALDEIYQQPERSGGQPYDMKSVAAQNGLQYDTMAAVTPADLEKGMPGSMELARRLFEEKRLEQNMPTNPVRMAQGRLIYQVLDVFPPKPAPFDQVRAQVYADARAAKAFELAVQIASAAAKSAKSLDAVQTTMTEELAQRIAQAKPDTDTFQKDPAKYYLRDKSEFFGRAQDYYGIGMRLAMGTGIPDYPNALTFVDTAFRLKGDEIGVAPEPRGAQAVFVLQRMGTEAFDKAEFERDKAQMMETALQEKRQAALTSWMEDVRRRAQPSESVMKFLKELPQWSDRTGT